MPFTKHAISPAVPRLRRATALSLQHANKQCRHGALPSLAAPPPPSNQASAVVQLHMEVLKGTVLIFRQDVALWVPEQMVLCRI